MLPLAMMRAYLGWRSNCFRDAQHGADFRLLLREPVELGCFTRADAPIAPLTFTTSWKGLNSYHKSHAMAGRVINERAMPETTSVIWDLLPLVLLQLLHIPTISPVPLHDPL
jgi:hypothetical protein